MSARLEKVSRVLLVCYVDSKIGVGHLSRLLALASELKKFNKVTVEFMIFGSLIKKAELSHYKVYCLGSNEDFVKEIKNMEERNHFDAMVFDLYPMCNKKEFLELFHHLKLQSVILISIDSLIEYHEALDIIWIPSFNFESKKYNNKIKSGWNSLLLQKRFHHKDWSPGKKVLILTGGSDTAKLGKTLPAQLDQFLKDNIEVHWVKGPFSKEPNLPDKLRLKWVIHDAPEQLDELITQSNYVISVYGISLFEVLQYGIPVVTFSPYGEKDNVELTALSKVEVAMTAENSRMAIDRLLELMNNNELAKKISKNALRIMSNNGAKNLSSEIRSLIGLK